MTTFTVTYAQLATPHTGLHAFGSPAELVKTGQMFLEMLENEADTFIFIISRDQWRSWKSWLLDNKLIQFVTFEAPYWIHNPNYKPPAFIYGRLRLVILKGKGNANQVEV